MLPYLTWLRFHILVLLSWRGSKPVTSFSSIQTFRLFGGSRSGGGGGVVSRGWIDRRKYHDDRLFQSSFTADSSEYSTGGGRDDYEDDEDGSRRDYGRGGNSYLDDDEDDTPTVEMQPVPMSKNAGNRFVVLLWDQELDDRGRDELDLHYDRIALTQDHVMFCRKTNLYNETFNTESMVDILWSLPILSSDLLRVIGHAMILESTELEYIREWLSREPITNMLSGTNRNPADVVPLYRWRHIRDYTLRIDDGRFGYPCLCVAIDDDPEEVGNLREETRQDDLEYLIRSKRVIAAGPLHLPTEFKDDPSSIAVGNLILYNAKDRNDAIDFAEKLPSAEQGLYKTMRVHFYNQLDITGKFVSEDPLRDAPCADMKEAMKYWGYPVEDNQTPWLNW